MSCSGIPARAAIPSPSPVLMNALVEWAKMRPAPPVASIVAFGIADEIERHPLDEEMRVGANVALIERVQQRMAGAVGGRAGALHRLFAEVRRVAPEGALIDRAVGVAVEWHPE